MDATVAIAIGSNLGDRFYNIELALRLLEVPQVGLSSEDLLQCGAGAYVTVVDTSFMYETTPMYVTDQPSFINCACLIETNIPPVILLHLLKHIETTVGRVPSIRNGPRAVDLDIVLYGTDVIDTRTPSERKNLDNLTGELVVPHPRLAEREFVLRPLNDMIPDFAHPVSRRTISELLGALPEEDPSMQRVIPFPRYPLPANHVWAYPEVPVVPPTLTHWTYPIVESKQPKLPTGRKTRIMSTLNATPDSFSDGATHNTLRTAMDYARESVDAGASIIDIGGYSTKPGAAFVSAEEETNRIVPIVEAIRGLDTDASNLGDRLKETLISIDTFRWEVARASILAGANCINDVYAFTGREDAYPLVDANAMKRADESMTGMKSVAREFAVPAVLMHSRGDAGKNKNYDQYGTGPGAVIRGVQVELGAKTERIIKGKGGVRRWMVIVDPGVGFSKTVEGNLEVLRDGASVVADVQANGKRNLLRGYSQLVGTSRKSFLGVILAQGDRGRQTAPRERVWATAAGVVCAVQQGALVGQSFLDHLIVNVRGGNGGNGCAAFHREKYKPFGPPSGGNGGRGGDVYILPTSHLTTLSSVPPRIRGEAGGHGQGTWQNGRNGEPLIIRVPLGTVVRELPRDDPRRAKDEWEAEEESTEGLTPFQKRDKMRENRWVHYPRFGETNVQRDSFKEAEAALYKQERERRIARRKKAQTPIYLDLDKEEHHERAVDAPLGIKQHEPTGYLIAAGGLGGLGNPHFTTAVNRSPKFATRGHEGERITLSLELKLLADIGLVGMPNAGKSTLLRALTGGRAKTEVAGYAFTTLNPVVGVVRVAEDGTFEGGLSENKIHDETLMEEEQLQERMEKGELADALTRNETSKEEEDVEADEIILRPGHRFDLVENFRFTIADNPGLISRAAENVGLGHSFLRSMERSLALVYVVDLSGPAPWEELRVLRDELEQYQPDMSTKARMVIANKADLLAGDGDPAAVEDAKRKLSTLQRFVNAQMVVNEGTHAAFTLDVVPTSAKFSQNLSKVVGLMRSYVEEAREGLF
ncbi:hypothetical protein DXG01_013766 [Tephrocybe rancida]|nr:hypothetical protein DXG01_013766 [Tephrocybe rancida]